MLIATAHPRALSSSPTSISVDISSTAPSTQGPSSKRISATNSVSIQSLPSWVSWIGHGGPPIWTDGGPPWLNGPTSTGFPTSISAISTNTQLSQIPAAATAPPQTSADDMPSPHRKVFTAAIAGIIVAGVAVVVLFVVGCIFMRRRSRRRKAALPFHLNEPVKKNTTPPVQPYTLAPSFVAVRTDSKSRHWFAEPGLDGAGHDSQLWRDTRLSNPQGFASVFTSNIQQAPSIDVDTSPISRTGTQDIQHLSAQVATLRHQVLHIQMQSNPPYYSPSPSIEAPPSYLVLSSATSAENADGINEDRKHN